MADGQPVLKRSATYTILRDYDAEIWYQVHKDVLNQQRYNLSKMRAKILKDSGIPKPRFGFKAKANVNGNTKILILKQDKGKPITGQGSGMNVSKDTTTITTATTTPTTATTNDTGMSNNDYNNKAQSIKEPRNKPDILC